MANKKTAKVTDKKEFLISDGQDLDVILAIISKDDVDRPNLPFFSKVALRHTKRRLKAYNCNLEIKNINKLIRSNSKMGNYNVT